METEMKAIKQKPPVERQESDLEIAPVTETSPFGIITNQQEHNGEGCRNVTKDIKKFLDNVGVWSKKLDELFDDSQLQAKMIKDITESHQGLGKIEHKIATFEPKLSSLESLQQEMTNRIITQNTLQQKVEGDIQTLKSDIEENAKIIPKISTFEQNFANQELNDQKINKKISKLEAVLVAGDYKINNEDIINLKAEIDKKMVGKLEENKQQIETRMQAMEGLGTQLKHLVDKITQVETTTDINTYILHKVTMEVQNTQWSKQKHIFKGLNDYIEKLRCRVKNKHPLYFEKATRIFDPPFCS